MTQVYFSSYHCYSAYGWLSE